MTTRQDDLRWMSLAIAVARRQLDDDEDQARNQDQCRDHSEHAFDDVRSQ